MKKLSEQLLEMSQRTAAWEDRTAARREENREESEAEVAEARKSVQASQEAFAAKLDSMHDSMSSHWREVQKSFDNQVAAARQKANEGKAAHDLASAQRRADLDEAYAEAAGEFAQLTAAEHYAAMVDATQARAHAKSLEKAPEKTTS